MWIKDLIECSSSVPKELLYLELTILPIRYVIKIGRLLYFHYLLKQRKESLINKFFFAPLSNPTHRDWVSQVLQELEDLEIKYEIHDLESMSRERYKNMNKEVVYKKAFSELLHKKTMQTV